MDYSLPGSSAHGISHGQRQECWNGLPFPSSGDLPNPGIYPSLLHLQVDFLPLSYQGSPLEITLESKGSKDSVFILTLDLILVLFHHISLLNRIQYLTSCMKFWILESAYDFAPSFLCFSTSEVLMYNLCLL